MEKISTLFKKDPNDLSRVINEVDPQNEWAIENGWATRKFDGTACMVKDLILYKRFDAKPGRKIPKGAIPCCPPDPITGHWPHWVKCDRNDPADRYHFEAFYQSEIWADATYELCGPKINGNPEHFERHELIPHGCWFLNLFEFTFEKIRQFLTDTDIEGIVFWEIGGKRMCKIRKSDFGIKR